MNAKAALAKAFLEGRVINIKNCFDTIGLTNAPHEVSRMIEKPFGVQISRTSMAGKSRYGQDVSWYDYRLDITPENLEGIEKMKTYVESQGGNVSAYAQKRKAVSVPMPKKEKIVKILKAPEKVLVQIGFFD